MISERQRIAEELLGCALDGVYAPCPGREHHTTKDGKKDFRVCLDGAPTAFCLHSHCADAVAAFNLELRRRIYFAEHGHSPAPRGHWGEGVAQAPKHEAKARPKLNLDLIDDYVRSVPEVDEDWLASRSAEDVSEVGTPGDFLNVIYEPGERVLIFTAQYSQGDFLWWVDKGGFRLSEQRGVKAVSSRLPNGTKDGVWFLVQPVTGKWEIKPKEEEAQYTRRSEVNVTAWRYFVLESDELEPARWLKVLVNLPLPIVAIYTSGGRSIHALVRWEVASKAEWDAVRNVLRQIVCPLGADPAALTAVRLSRLPGCMRGDRKQRLLYLNPNPGDGPIRLLPALR